MTSHKDMIALIRGQLKYIAEFLDTVEGQLSNEKLAQKPPLTIELHPKTIWQSYTGKEGVEKWRASAKDVGKDHYDMFVRMLQSSRYEIKDGFVYSASKGKGNYPDTLWKKETSP